MPIDNKKEREREEVHRAIWAIADPSDNRLPDKFLL